VPSICKASHLELEEKVYMLGQLAWFVEKGHGTAEMCYSHFIPENEVRMFMQVVEERLYVNEDMSLLQYVEREAGRSWDANVKAQFPLAQKDEERPQNSNLVSCEGLYLSWPSTKKWRRCMIYSFHSKVLERYHAIGGKGCLLSSEMHEMPVMIQFPLDNEWIGTDNPGEYTIKWAKESLEDTKILDSDTVGVLVKKKFRNDGRVQETKLEIYEYPGVPLEKPITAMNNLPNHSSPFYD